MLFVSGISIIRCARRNVDWDKILFARWKATPLAIDILPLYIQAYVYFALVRCVLNMKQKLLLERILPVSLLVLLLVVMLITVFTQASSYGLTTDEAVHDSYGQSVLEWYLTLGKNQSFLHFPAADYEPEHGAIFDVVVAIAQRVSHEQWYTEAIITGLTGVLAVIGLALCGLELGGWWFAFLAGLTLWLYPRFFGAIFNNPKDIPFIMANVFVLWSVLRLLKRWEDRRVSILNSFLVAFFLAVAIAIRANAVAWYFILFFLLVGWWVLNLRPTWQKKQPGRAIKQQAITGVIIGAGSFLGTILLWPYIFLNPIANFYNALVVISKYPWNGSVLYQGQMVLATELPRSYAPVWLVIGSPPVLLLFSLVGVLLFAGLCIKKRILDLPLIVVLLSFLVPFGIIVGFHSVIYNGLRQFLFLVPSLILLAVYSFIWIFAFLWQRRQFVLAGVLILLACANYAWTVKDMIALHPYEYTYFSPLVGGLQGAETQFEADYWNTCQEAASKWLANNYQDFVSTKTPTVPNTNTQFQYLTYLPANFQVTDKNPDFLIEINVNESTQQFPEYRLIHTEAVEGVPLCRVYLNKDIG